MNPCGACSPGAFLSFWRCENPKWRERVPVLPGGSTATSTVGKSRCGFSTKNPGGGLLSLRRQAVLRQLSAKTSGRPGRLGQTLQFHLRNPPASGHPSVGSVLGTQGVCHGRGGSDLGHAPWTQSAAGAGVARKSGHRPAHGGAVANVVAGTFRGERLLESGPSPIPASGLRKNSALVAGPSLRDRSPRSVAGPVQIPFSHHDWFGSFASHFLRAALFPAEDAERLRRCGDGRSFPATPPQRCHDEKIDITWKKNCKAPAPMNAGLISASASSELFWRRRLPEANCNTNSSNWRSKSGATP